MTNFLRDAGGSGCGVFPANVDVRVVNRSSASTVLSAGDVVAFCTNTHANISVGSIDTESPYPGGRGSIFANVTKTIATQDRDGGFAAVVLETIPYRGIGRVRVRGIANANVISTTSASIPIGAAITLPLGLGAATTASGYFDSTANVASTNVVNKVFGFTCASMADATTSTGALIPVCFDGINGMGGLNT